MYIFESGFLLNIISLKLIHIECAAVYIVEEYSMYEYNVYLFVVLLIHFVSSFGLLKQHYYKNSCICLMHKCVSLSDVFIYSRSRFDSLYGIYVLIPWILANGFQVDFTRVNSYQQWLTFSHSRFVLVVSLNLHFPNEYDVE